VKVHGLIAKCVMSSPPDTNLAAGGTLVWENNCGVIPFVSDCGRLTGILTYRDMCIALATRNRQPLGLAAAEIATKPAVVLVKTLRTVYDNHRNAGQPQAA
jgi:CBS domain-containing protein